MVAQMFCKCVGRILPIRFCNFTTNITAEWVWVDSKIRASVVSRIAFERSKKDVDPKNINFSTTFLCPYTDTYSKTNTKTKNYNQKTKNFSPKNNNFPQKYQKGPP